MLLDDNDRRIEGPQGAVLFEVYTTLIGLLEGSGHTREQADALALALLWLHDRWAQAGFLVRQVDRVPHATQPGTSKTHREAGPEDMGRGANRWE